MEDATTSVSNTNQTPTALGPLWEDPHRAAIAKGVTTVVVVPVAAVAAVAEAPPTALEEESVEAVTAEAEATRIATPLATHIVATTPAIGSTRSIASRQLKLATVTASLPTLPDYATCSFLRNSNLSGSPSKTWSKTQFSGSGATP
jgi:hypothetical protein